MKYFTTTISAGQSLNIDRSDGAMFVSVLCDASTGACTLTGTIPFKGNNSSAVALTAGQGFSLAAENSGSPLDGVIINATAGTVAIIVGF